MFQVGQLHDCSENRPLNSLSFPPFVYMYNANSFRTANCTLNEQRIVPKQWEKKNVSWQYLFQFGQRHDLGKLTAFSTFLW